MDDRLLSYLYYFNIARDYFECHEYGESLWLDSGRPDSLKGLIQAAVCLYHLQRGNVRGGFSMWLRAKKYLAPYLPIYEGMDIAKLTKDIDAVFGMIPASLYDKVVFPETVAAYPLPRVKITIVDPEVEQAVSTWTPKPLSDR